MKLELNLDFLIPIWRFFYPGPVEIPDLFRLYNNNTILNKLKNKNYICIIQIGCYIDENIIKYTDYMNEIPMYYGENHIICVPNMYIFNCFKKYRPKLNLCLTNHNAFIDETLYKIDETQKVTNDLFVSSQFLKEKNLNLLHDIENICGVGYYPCSEDNKEVCIITFPKSVKKVLNFANNVERKQKNWKWVDPIENIKEINSSKIGGIFSTVEGSCFSSSEYLLCGIPVLSCKCKGGREIWYDNNNSTLCEPTNSSIKENLKKMLIKYNNGEYNRESIRNNHIKIMKIHRNNLSNAVLNIMKKIFSVNNLPSLEELTTSLKYYHSNNRGYCYTYGYQRQSKREVNAQFIKNLIKYKI